MTVLLAAREDAKLPEGARKDAAAAIPAAAVPLLGSADPVKLHKELRDLFGAELDPVLREREKGDSKQESKQ